jgi:hypothetical protein
LMSNMKFKLPIFVAWSWSLLGRSKYEILGFSAANDPFLWIVSWQLVLLL